ncbi:MAG: aminotransferase class III-fold pyridoxal phosphate-dependent enzyme, partial [Phycisphaerae bacterium]
ILHFRQAFHGRSGYTLSLTNTDPRKTDLFAKFDWPRVTNPAIDFSLDESKRGQHAAADEEKAVGEIRAALQARPHEIAAIIIEPIQGEGGDKHFRGEFLHELRGICDEHDLLLIFDEIQCGMGVTGRMWCCQHFDVLPDLLAFGKKSQVCGVMAGPRLDDVPENVFRTPGRINSTWGGNLADMVRCKHLLHIYEHDDLVNHAARMGQRLLTQLQALAAEAPILSGVRGRGLMLAFDLENGALRDSFWQGCYDQGLLMLRCGTQSIRLRPALDVTPDVVDAAIDVMRKHCRQAQN